MHLVVLLQISPVIPARLWRGDKKSVSPRCEDTPALDMHRITPSDAGARQVSQTVFLARVF
ncbi:hypothetical protein [Barnesiella viscericola]|uniref:hypothetical protein n=1 Tax=Barnesiella viscericola TaxID=397865 RepID=UPI00255BBE5E|nr:hypothetical protein [Barnesiella viscericola]